MSQAKNSSKYLTRRTVLAGTTASVAGLAFGLPGNAAATIKPGPTAASAKSSDELCVAHHKELSQHLRSVLNSSYVDENMKNRTLSRSHCPHCKVGIAPDQMHANAKDQAAFSVLS